MTKSEAGVIRAKAAAVASIFLPIARKSPVRIAPSSGESNTGRRQWQPCPPQSSARANAP
jgi:hypothetical protein